MAMMKQAFDAANKAVAAQESGEYEQAFRRYMDAIECFVKAQVVITGSSHYLSRGFNEIVVKRAPNRFRAFRWVHFLTFFKMGVPFFFFRMQLYFVHSQF